MEITMDFALEDLFAVPPPKIKLSEKKEAFSTTVKNQTTDVKNDFIHSKKDSDSSSKGKNLETCGNVQSFSHRKVEFCKSKEEEEPKKSTKMDSLVNMGKNDSFDLDDLFSEPPPKIRLINKNIVPSRGLASSGNDINKTNSNLEADSTERTSSRQLVDLNDLFSEPPPKVTLGKNDCNLKRTQMTDNICSNKANSETEVNSEKFRNSRSDGKRHEVEDDYHASVDEKNFNSGGKHKRKKAGNYGRKYHSKCRISATKMEKFMENVNADDYDDFFGEPVLRSLPVQQSKPNNDGSQPVCDKVVMSKIDNKDGMSGLKGVVANVKELICTENLANKQFERVLPRKQDLESDHDAQKNLNDKRNQNTNNKWNQSNGKSEIKNGPGKVSRPESKNKKRKKKKKKSQNQKQLKKDHFKYVDLDDPSIVLPPRIDANPHKWPVRSDIIKRSGTSDTHKANANPSKTLGGNEMSSNGIKGSNQNKLEHSILDDILSHSNTKSIIAPNPIKQKVQENSIKQSSSQEIFSKVALPKADLLKIGRQNRVSRCLSQDRGSSNVSFIHRSKEDSAENVNVDNKAIARKEIVRNEVKKVNCRNSQVDWNKIGNLNNITETSERKVNVNGRKMFNKEKFENEWYDKTKCRKRNIGQDEKDCLNSALKYKDNYLQVPMDDLLTDGIGDGKLNCEKQNTRKADFDDVDDLVINFDDCNYSNDHDDLGVHEDSMVMSHKRKKIKLYNYEDSESENVELNDNSTKIESNKSLGSEDVTEDSSLESLMIMVDKIPDGSSGMQSTESTIEKRKADPEMVIDSRRDRQSSSKCIDERNNESKATQREFKADLAKGGKSLRGSIENASLLNLVADSPLDLSVACKTHELSARDRSKRGGRKKKVRHREQREEKRKREASEKKEKRPMVKCKYFKDGKCRMGEDCNFLHEGKPERRELCKYYVIDSCILGENCIFMHSDFPCKFFHVYSKCANGDNCKFSHQPLTEETNQLLQQAISRDDKKTSEEISEERFDESKTETKTDNNCTNVGNNNLEFLPLYEPIIEKDSSS